MTTEIGFSNENIINSFDTVNAPWYSIGVIELGPMFAVRDRNESISWENPSSDPPTVLIDYGRQRPFISIGYFITNVIPIYLSCGGVSTDGGGVHTCTMLDTRANTLPIFQFRMQESGGVVDTIIHQYNCKSHTLKLSVDRLNPMQTFQMISGTDRWISDNTYWMDGSTSATGYTSLMNSPSLYTDTSAICFYLDNLSEITINGVDVSKYVIKAETNISQMTRFVYQTDATFQEEVWPSDTYELTPIIPLSCDFDLIMGIENTLLKGSMESGAISISAKFYSDKDKVYYIHWDFSSSAYRNEVYTSIPNPNNPKERIIRLRFMCDYSSTIKMKDGIPTIPSFQ